MPEFDPESSKWLSETGYIIDRDRWLMPFQTEIIGLLEKLEGAV